MVKRVASVLALASVAFAYRPTPLRMALPRQDVLRPFQEGRALKVISGLTNLDAALVGKVAKAAAAGGATHVDIACEASLVRVAKAAAGSWFPVMVSSIEPEAFGAAIEAGADMLELGNFDSFYERGLVFSAMEVLDLTARTKALYPTMPLSVTIPHTIPMSEQVSLAASLAHLGVDVIQTEGSPAVHTKARAGTVAWHMEKAVPALAATYALARAAPSTPVMAASGLSEVTAAMALASGAKAVGIGAAVNKLPTEEEMVAKVQAIANAMHLRLPTPTTANKAVHSL